MTAESEPEIAWYASHATKDITMTDITPETHPELVWAHRGAVVHYSVNVAAPDTLFAWITLHDGRRESVTERLLRVIQDPGAPEYGPIDPTASRRSFQAAVVARIDHALDCTAGSWVGGLAAEPRAHRGS